MILFWIRLILKVNHSEVPCFLYYDFLFFHDFKRALQEPYWLVPSFFSLRIPMVFSSKQRPILGTTRADSHGCSAAHFRMPQSTMVCVVKDGIEHPQSVTWRLKITKLFRYLLQVKTLAKLRSPATGEKQLSTELWGPHLERTPKINSGLKGANVWV